jgi:hypothetical protein
MIPWTPLSHFTVHRAVHIAPLLWSRWTHFTSCLTVPTETMHNLHTISKTSVIYNMSLSKLSLLPLYKESRNLVGCEVLRVVVMKSTIFWDVMCFASHLLSYWHLSQLILQIWKLRWYVPPRCRLTSNGLHGIISQQILAFKTEIYLHINKFWITVCFWHYSS